MMKHQHILVLISLSLTVLFVSCSDLKRDLPTATSSGVQVHNAGWIDESSANFHGKAIQGNGWNTSDCKSCHGPDYSGGTSGKSCLLCHNQAGGPENCRTCHGGNNAAPPKDLAGNTNSPRVGAHQAHLLADSVFAAVSCNECHTVPSTLASAGHIDLTGRAEVLFNGSVVKSSFGSHAGTATRSYSYTSFRCDNIYCHGYFPNGNNASPVWNDVTGQYKACGSCHGDTSQSTIGLRALPKTRLNGGTHLSQQDNSNILQCYRCHSSAIDANYKLSSSKHVNGYVDFN
jgi:predicted CxxxxCH...CXXCH cytochrome family protein